MARRTLVSMGLKFTSLGLGFGATALMARLMDKADFGLYSFAISIIMILGVLVQFGLPTLATRELARLSEAGGWGEIRGFGRFSGLVTMLLSVLCVGLGYALLRNIVPLPAGFAPYILLVLFIVPINAALKLTSGQVRGLNRVIVSQFPELLIRPGLLFVFVAVVFAIIWQGETGGLKGALSLETVLWVYAVAAGLGAVFGALVLWRNLAPHSGTPVMPADLRTQWLRAGFPLMLTSGVLVLNQNLDVVILGALADPEDIAVYRVCTRLTALIAFGLAAVSAVTAPQFSRRYYAGDMAAVQRIARRGALQSLGLAVPFVVIFGLFPNQVLTLAFGTDYAVGAPALRILCIGQLINASFGVLGTVLNMTGQERYTMIGVGLAALASTLLNLVLVPRFGINGAAIAQTISFVIWNGMLAYFITKRLGIVTLPFLPQKQIEGL